MAEDDPEKPPVPELPKYLREPLENQSPERLEAVATYAADLAEWKRRQREEELERRRAEDEVDEEELERRRAEDEVDEEELERRRAEDEVDEEELEKLDEREISTDPEDYEDVPTSGAYITVKTTKQTSQKEYNYFYWQWREGDSWKNEYIAPVNPRE